MTKGPRGTAKDCEVFLAMPPAQKPQQVVESTLQLVPSPAEVAIQQLENEFRLKVDLMRGTKYPEPLELDE